jgi:hypothetical protein
LPGSRCSASGTRPVRGPRRGAGPEPGGGPRAQAPSAALEPRAAPRRPRAGPSRTNVHAPMRATGRRTLCAALFDTSHLGEDRRELDLER